MFYVEQSLTIKYKQIFPRTTSLYIKFYENRKKPFIFDKKCDIIKK